MALITCSECGRQISSQAATCPGCGAPVTARSIEARADSIWSKRIGCGGVIGVLFLVFLAIGFLSPKIDDPADATPGSYSTSAARACEEFVTRRLKAPSTADFPREERSVTYESTSDSYRILAAVDSQNGFGAKIRTRYTCRVTPEGDQFRLVELTIHE